ncbi:hypothetical protein BJX65DRAFT_295596 [Aspergillus insuetus]
MSPLSSLRATLTQIYPPKPAFTEAQVPPGSQRGRVFIVTGGNAGIGFELSKILYAAGATVYIASRSKEKVEAAIESIKSTTLTPTTSGQLKFLHLDLNDLRIVKAAAESFASQESKLDVLWNNAGTGANGRPCRDGSPPNGIDFSVLDTGVPNKPMVNYGASKAGKWFLSCAFARRYKADGITASFEGTPAVAMWIMNRVMLSEPVFGAYTELFAGLSNDVKIEDTGAYIIPWGRIRKEKATPRHDLIRAGRTLEEGGLGVW